MKVIGERRYIDYSGANALGGGNIRQALSSLKNLMPSGPYSELDLDDTIDRTAKNGGDIELVFRREFRDKIEVVLLLDNGGSSMLPFVNITRLLFSKVRDRFKEFTPYFFHNVVYESVYRDPTRLSPLSTWKLLERNPDTRIIIVGDASMAPEELVSPYGSIYFGGEHPEPGINWLGRIRERFKYSLWLNPIPREDWRRSYGAWTIDRIGSIIQMEDLTISGIRRGVEYLNSRA